MILRFMLIRCDWTEVLYVAHLPWIHILLTARHSYIGKLKKLVLLDLNHLKVLSLFTMFDLRTEIEPDPHLLGFPVRLLPKYIP